VYQGVEHSPRRQLPDHFLPDGRIANPNDRSVLGGVECRLRSDRHTQDLARAIDVIGLMKGSDSVAAA
jgi:hypothetical protein